MERNHGVTERHLLLDENGELTEPGWFRHLLQVRDFLSIQAALGRGDLIDMTKVSYKLKRTLIPYIIIACIIIPLCLKTGCFDPASATDKKQNGVEFSGKINIDGEDIDCICCEINDRYYYRLKDLAYLLNGTGSQFNVKYGEKLKSVTITTRVPYIPDGNEMKEIKKGKVTAESFKTELIINGEKKKNDAPKMYKIGEDVFINSRDFRTVFNIAAEWDDSWERDYIFTYIKSDIDALNTIETEYGIIIYLVS